MFPNVIPQDVIDYIFKISEIKKICNYPPPVEPLFTDEDGLNVNTGEKVDVTTCDTLDPKNPDHIQHALRILYRPEVICKILSDKTSRSFTSKLLVSADVENFKKTIRDTFGKENKIFDIIIEVAGTSAENIKTGDPVEAYDKTKLSALQDFIKMINDVNIRDKTGGSFHMQLLEYFADRHGAEVMKAYNPEPYTPLNVLCQDKQKMNLFINKPERWTNDFGTKLLSSGARIICKPCRDDAR